jgi:hypothetical protein
MGDHQQLLPDSFDAISVELDDYFDEARTCDTFACSYVPGQRLEEEFEELCVTCPQNPLHG